MYLQIRLAALLLIISGSAHGNDFFKSRSISLLIGSGTGGGHDVYARLTAPFLSKHIPGNPTVVPKSMVGAGGRKVIEYLMTQSIRDGTEIAAVIPEALSPLSNEKSAYETRTLTPLGSALSGLQVCITGPESRVQRIEDIRDAQVTRFGATASDSPTSQAAYVLKNIVDADHRSSAQVQVIAGYASVREIILAMQRNEVDGVCGIEWSSLIAIKPEWAPSGGAHVLAHMGPVANVSISGRGRLPDARDYVSTQNRDILDIAVLSQRIARPYFAPPGIPIERALILERALWDAWSDPEFVALMEKQQLEVAPVTAKNMGDVIRTMFTASPELIDRARRALR